MKVLWDFEIWRDKIIPTKRPDIVVIDKKTRTTTIIDIAVPLDWKLKDKEDEKILKYQDLRMEIQKLWNTEAKLIIIIVGSLGATLMNFDKHSMKIPGKHNSPALTNSALVGSTNIQRHVSDL